jgi:hypothetical protein
LNWKINQVYPWLKADVALGKELFRKYPEVIKYTKQLFAHRLGSFFQFQVTPFLVYVFVSLQMAAYCGNFLQLKQIQPYGRSRKTGMSSAWHRCR